MHQHGSMAFGIVPTNNPMLFDAVMLCGVMGKKRVEYRCVATSIEGFVQQVAVQYLRHGYWFYVAGQIPEGKDPAAVDAKLIKKYGIDVSRWERARRKRDGLANMQYIRQGRFFLLMATHGGHSFFDHEKGQARDARRVAIRYGGYSISHRNGRVSVRIAPNEYAQLKAHFLELACCRQPRALMCEFAQIQFQVYAPIRVQLLAIWRSVNQLRRSGGFELVTIDAVPWRRRICRPFAAGA